MDKHFHEGGLISNTTISNALTIPFEGRDKRANGHESSLRHQSGHLTSPANVFGPALSVESEVLTKTLAQTVAIQHKAFSAASVDLPAPDNPVSQTTTPRCCMTRHRAS